MKHTPGPWLYAGFDFQRNAHRIATNSGDERITMKIECTHFYEEAKTNAHLIASAPDLYEALKATRAQWIHSVNGDLCLAALAKAEGKSEGR